MVSSAPLAKLLAWAQNDGYPLWWRVGTDQANGGFHEKVAQDGLPVILAKRARVQPRQIYCFSKATALGWNGDAAEAVQFGIDFFLARYLRPDGLVRTLVSPEGAALDEKAAFYDQAFALLGLHSAHLILGHQHYLDLARALIASWSLGHKHPEGGFEESVPRSLPLCSNPHMHLFESCLAWLESDPAGPWRAIADDIASLAMTRFIDQNSGALREFFAGDWSPMPGAQGRVVEPGHQFEWSWLLMRWGQLSGDARALPAALRLIEIGEGHGVDPARGVAFNSLTDDLAAADRRARLWPQTERLKAHCLAAEITGKPDHWLLAEKAAEGLLLYLDTPIRGLWYDILTEHDGFIEEPAPASSFYHIICAIAEYRRVAALM